MNALVSDDFWMNDHLKDVKQVLKTASLTEDSHRHIEVTWSPHSRWSSSDPVVTLSRRVFLCFLCVVRNLTNVATT